MYMQSQSARREAEGGVLPAVSNWTTSGSPASGVSRDKAARITPACWIDAVMLESLACLETVETSMANTDSAWRLMEFNKFYQREERPATVPGAW